MTKRNDKTTSLKAKWDSLPRHIQVFAVVCIIILIVGIISSIVSPNLSKQVTSSSSSSSQAVSSSVSSVSSSATSVSSSVSSVSSAPPSSSMQQSIAYPQFDGEHATVTVDGNNPSFSETDINNAMTGYESYADLDSHGRCGVAEALVGRETMPADGEKRESISSVKPSGWNNAKYTFVDGGYVYNRCHLIGWQLTAENANGRNLVTGTRYMNIEGMLPYENQVANYVRSTGGHVLYRVTPVFEGDDLVCRGVEMEALSVEDGGKGVKFDVFAHNVQPGVVIDYVSGKNHAE